MRKLIKILFICLLFSPIAWADRGDWGERHDYYGDHRDWDRGRGGFYQQREYYPPRPVEYYPPQPQYVAPQPQYYAPPPRYYGYPGPSPQGLVGSVVGGAVGYEISNGNPLAAGIGTAAGAWIGNEITR